MKYLYNVTNSNNRKHTQYYTIKIETDHDQVGM